MNLMRPRYPDARLHQRQGCGRTHLPLEGGDRCGKDRRPEGVAFRCGGEPDGKPSRAEQYGATFIADGRDEVLTAVRENLRFGASQLKPMAGGGTSSAHGPVGVTQYTLDEMKAAVEAAEDWGTDFLIEPELNEQQNACILKLQQWFSNAEILKMVTHDNAELLQPSGLRSPYPGRLGVVQDLGVIARPAKITVIMKDGKIFRNIPAH